MRVLVACENRSEYAQRSEKEDTKLTHVTLLIAPAVIQNGTSNRMLFRCRTVIVRFRLLTHTHTLDGKWDLIIAHPPCTYLSAAGNGYFDIEKYGNKAIERYKKREQAAEFFMKFVTAECDRIAIENPVGYMNSYYRKSDQIIHPYFFAQSENDEQNYHKKRTCLWLKGIPALKRISLLPEPKPIYIDRSGKKRYYCDAITGNSKDGKKQRSKTFTGIAKAMAEQWG